MIEWNSWSLNNNSNTANLEKLATWLKITLTFPKSTTISRKLNCKYSLIFCHSHKIMLGGYLISTAKQPVNITIRNDILRNKISNLSEIILLILRTISRYKRQWNFYLWCNKASSKHYQMNGALPFIPRGI